MPADLRGHIPNALTVLRLLLAAAFFALLGSFQFPVTGVAAGNGAVAFFIAAALTDWLDGSLARRWNAVTVFGRIMDPFCDKVLILGAFVYLAGPGFMLPADTAAAAGLSMSTGVYPWMVVVILARELLVTSIRGVAESSGTGFGARTLGKAKMILQSCAVPVMLLLAINFRPDLHPPLLWVTHGLALLTTAVTVLSVWPYLGMMRPFLRSEPGGAAS
ncbi:MAG: CDP-alcohol phosphatidyltransferase family protein [Phycisphaeraceae bacterium]|nr:CDP-alcohol phosphatidyltransferase family protein [Phycisphaeraceae bacterium]